MMCSTLVWLHRGSPLPSCSQRRTAFHRSGMAWGSQSCQYCCSCTRCHERITFESANEDHTTRSWEHASPLLCPPGYSPKKREIWPAPKPKKDEVSPAESWSSINHLVQTAQMWGSQLRICRMGRCLAATGSEARAARLAGRDQRRAKDESSQVAPIQLDEIYCNAL